MAGQECGKDQAELRYGGTIAFPSEHKTKLVHNRSIPSRSVPSPSEHGLNLTQIRRLNPSRIFVALVLDSIAVDLTRHKFYV